LGIIDIIESIRKDERATSRLQAKLEGFRRASQQYKKIALKMAAASIAQSTTTCTGSRTSVTRISAMDGLFPRQPELPFFAQPHTDEEGNQTDAGQPNDHGQGDYR
jgi:hypothetical protein